MKKGRMFYILNYVICQGILQWYYKLHMYGRLNGNVLVILLVNI